MDGDTLSMGSTRSSVPSSSRRRSWAPLEEKILIGALKEIVAEGWKSENGFRSGYLGCLEKIIRRTIPQTDLKAEPHISSKIHVWKKIHGSLTTLLSRSGLSWVQETHMLFVDDESVWNDHIKTDSYAKRLRNKSFPYFNDWNEIFGKDRATGENAEDVGAAAATQLPTDEEFMYNVGAANHSDGEEIMSPATNVADVQAPGSSSAKENNSHKRKRKLTVDAVGEEMVSLMGKFCEQASNRLTEIASKIGYEFSLSSKRERLFEAVSGLKVLKPEDILVVVRRLANSVNDLDLFFTLPQDEQSRLVLMMATGDY